jgi:7,8-dihydropterin-6-yl-methyl-4-(beta-D-ribofuranosyl)aminobenzene 5'-phosphate synthase
MGPKNLFINILVDNKAASGLMSEHGVSVWIEAFGKRILFDTGQGKALLANAAALGIDLSMPDALVLSHGHYDHTGGITQVLKRNPAIKVYCHSNGVISRYSIHDATAPKNISMPDVQKSTILNLPTEQIFWTAHPLRMYPTIGLSGPIPQSNSIENVGCSFFLDPEGMRSDSIEDEMALWIQSDRGLVIVTGCCHSGLINTVNHVRRISGQEKISAIIGGLHLENASRQRLEVTCHALEEWDIDTIIPCHCTGDEAVTFMQNKLGGRVLPGYAGLSWGS